MEDPAHVEAPQDSVDEPTSHEHKRTNAPSVREPGKPSFPMSRVQKILKSDKVITQQLRMSAYFKLMS